MGVLSQVALFFLACTIPFIFCPYLLLGGGWEQGWFEDACGVQFQVGTGLAPVVPVTLYPCRPKGLRCELSGAHLPKVFYSSP